MGLNSHLIEMRDPAAIQPRVRSWRTYTPRQIAEAKCQLELTGTVIEPPLLDSEGRVVCGGAIVRAAQQLKWKQIPVLLVGNMTPEELRLYAINAHKLSDMGANDDAMLAEELRELEQLLGDDALKRLAIEESELTRPLQLDAIVSGEEPTVLSAFHPLLPKRIADGLYQ